MQRTELLNVIGFATGTEANTPLAVLSFNRSEFEDYRATIPALIANPGAFQSMQGDYAALMTTDQHARLLDYLAKGQFRMDPIQLKGKPEVILGLSFGEGPDVNELIAERAAAAAAQFPSADLHLQWELARLLRRLGGVDKGRIRPIDLDCDRDYITSAEVVDKFKRNWGRSAAPETYLVCQAWHAPRCLAICEAKGVNVVGAAFIDEFSPNDPQKWVRSWLAWVLKEGTK